MIAIDMEMPENCVECRFNTSEFEYCNAMPVEFVGQVSDREEDGKPEWCPLKAQEPITGETSDGYHTFNELYHHRAVLFSVIVANYPDRAWKSKKHHDGTMYDNMFIVGIDTPDGQATYHYDVEPYWDMFKCRVFDNAPEWDGHTPAQAIERIGKLKAQGPRVMTSSEVMDYVGYFKNNPPSEVSKLPLWTESKKETGVFSGYRNVGNIRNLIHTSGLDRSYIFNQHWRCWTARPTVEQMNNTPWEERDNGEKAK